MFGKKSPRDFVCSVSDLVQDYFGQDIWAKIVNDDNVKYSSKTEGSYNVVIDDWRRLIESDYLIAQKNFNIIKVYLEKTNLNKKPSKGSQKYEGTISKEDCDIVFTYNDDYSNFEELIGILTNELKQ